MLEEYVKKRFGEMWQQAESMTQEDDEAVAVMKFMQRYGELIVRECIWIVQNHPQDAAARIAETYEVQPDVGLQ